MASPSVALPLAVCLPVVPLAELLLVLLVVSAPVVHEPDHKRRPKGTRYGAAPASVGEALCDGDGLIVVDRSCEQRIVNRDEFAGVVWREV